MRLVATGMAKRKRCTKCRRRKVIAAFSRSKARKDGRHPQCKACVREYQKKYAKRPDVRIAARIYQREYARGEPRRRKIMEYQRSDAGRRTKWRSKIKIKYGLTEDQWMAIFKAQRGRCATCRGRFKSQKHTHTDHCHKTGKVRGILCHNCNRALGAVKDSPQILEALKIYLEKHDALGRA